MTEELQKKAENFIIERYKIVKCYREDNAETREYMRIDVHSQYEEEYQLYLAATKELQEENTELKKQNKILSKALNLYIDWADECGIAWDNFPDMTEKWYKIVEEKGLGWIAGLTFMVMEEAKEQLEQTKGKRMLHFTAGEV